MKVNKLKMQSLLVIPAKAGISLTFLFGLFAFLACTDYVAEIDEQIEELKAKQSGTSSSIEKVATREDLPSFCDEEGSIVYVEDEDVDYVCIDGAWHPPISSSSSSVKSSSSKKIESSSSSGSLNQFNPDVEYGELHDSRDGLTYKTVKIGSQTWMAQNLNYETSDSYCPDGNEKNCSTYGRLYKWNTAKTVCPAGWHLPSKDEFGTLLAKAGGGFMAGTELKALAGWNRSGNGNDSYGFSAIPAGYKSSDGQYAGVGYRAHFWSTTEDHDGYAYYMYVVYNDAAAYVSGNYYGGNLLSVRCLKDDETIASSSSSVSPKSSDSEASVSTGSMTDSRDGQTYKTVTIGSQIWMAENLNYETAASYCYNDVSSNCTKYGRLYTWAAAMDSAGTWTINGKGCGYGKTCSPTYPVRGVCPSGWHLPTQTEWNTLFTAVGGQSTAGKVLKSTSGWDSSGNGRDSCSGNGTDSFGFSVLPAGDWDYGGYYDYEGYDAHFWSSTEYHSLYAYGMSLFCNHAAGLSSDNKNYGYSVRCLQD